MSVGAKSTLNQGARQLAALALRQPKQVARSPTVLKNTAAEGDGPKNVAQPIDPVPPHPYPAG